MSNYDAWLINWDGHLLAVRWTIKGTIAELCIEIDGDRGMRLSKRREWIPRTQGAEISDEDLLGELQRLADQIGRDPKPSDMESTGEYSSGVYINRFGSWSGALNKTK